MTDRNQARTENRSITAHRLVAASQTPRKGVPRKSSTPTRHRHGGEMGCSGYETGGAVTEAVRTEARGQLEALR